MAETNLAFSKVVATPTPTAWSQAYSAGRLFAALSLQTETIPQEGDEHLNSLGKDFISTLESEFFTLENKDFESIKQAVNTTSEKTKEGVKISFVICYLNENVLYLFASGGGKAILKRGEKIGTVLEAADEQSIKSASGYVQENDLIVLQTKSFTRVIPSATLASALDNNNPDDIAENLAPHLHEKPEGAASAVVLLYKQMSTAEISSAAMPLNQPIAEAEKENNIDEKEIQTTESVINAPQDSTLEENPEISEPELKETPETDFGTLTSDQEEEKVTTETPAPFLTNQFPRRRRKISMSVNLEFLKKLPKNLGHSRKIILTIAVILITVIAISAFLAMRSRQNKSSEEAFASIFNVAKEKYNEGLNLKDLNASLAQESFKNAKEILEQNKDKFKEGSSEDNQIEDLLVKVNGQFTGGSGNETTAAEIDKSESKMLSYAIDNSGASYFTQNKDFVYFLDGKGANSIDKGNDSKETLFAKSWDKAGGIGIFGSNIYVLDTENGISKFVPTDDKYTENDYLKEDEDLSKAMAMAIDGSVYVIFSDGTVNKYTRGNKDEFSVSGMDKEMSSPTRIFTTEDFDNIYILDNGNSRIVVINKEGKFVSSYQAGVVKNATEIDVNEENKEIFVLSGGKVFKIDIK